MSIDNTDLDSNLKPLQRIPELFLAVGIFSFLVTLGVGNIMVSAGKKTEVSPTQTLEPTSTPPVLVTTEKVQPKNILTIKTGDGTNVNIRQKSTPSSKVIGKTKDGASFEFLSLNSEWYEVKLADGSTGFISAAFAQTEETNNQ